MRFLDKILSENRLVSCIILTLQVVLLYVLFYGLCCSAYTNYIICKTNKDVIYIEKEYFQVDCISLENFGDGLIQPIEPTEPGVQYDQLSTEPVESEFVGTLKTFKAKTRARKEYRFDLEDSSDIEQKQDEWDKANESLYRGRISA